MHFWTHYLELNLKILFSCCFQYFLYQKMFCNTTYLIVRLLLHSLPNRFLAILNFQWATNPTLWRLLFCFGFFSVQNKNPRIFFLFLICLVLQSLVDLYTTFYFFSPETLNMSIYNTTRAVTTFFLIFPKILIFLYFMNKLIFLFWSWKLFYNIHYNFGQVLRCLNFLLHPTYILHIYLVCRHLKCVTLSSSYPSFNSCCE